MFDSFRKFSPLQLAVWAVLSITTLGLALFGHPDHGLVLATGAGAVDAVLKAVESIEAKLKAMDDKAAGELKTLGEVSRDTKNALEKLGTDQLAMAERLMSLEQKGLLRGGEGSEGAKGDDSIGQQFIKSDGLDSFLRSGMRGRFGVEVKNTVTNTVANTFSDRKPAIVGGAFRTLTLEALLNSLPTSANAVDYVRENVFTNAAAETAEGAAKPESSITTSLITEPVATIAHWLKISKQLAADNAALAAYINTRLIYGVNLRVENQIISGNGTAPNMSGFAKSGNFTAHGYTAASISALGLAANRFDLIGKMIGDSQAGDFPADAIIVNPTDWWTMRLSKDSQGRYLLGDPGSSVAPSLFGLPVVSSNAMTADTVIVAALAQAATFYSREGVVVEMSDSDSDNFTKNLITVRAERRCMLAVERPAAVRYGDLTPA
jgi:HK97 family phage major capsid protein